jgi:hypothetical protein
MIITAIYFPRLVYRIGIKINSSAFFMGAHAVAQWLRHYATNRKVAGSTPDEANFYIYLILPAALGAGVYSAS